LSFKIAQVNYSLGDFPYQGSSLGSQRTNAIPQQKQTHRSIYCGVLDLQNPAFASFTGVAPKLDGNGLCTQKQNKHKYQIE
jgi:hypothetical protein